MKTNWHLRRAVLRALLIGGFAALAAAPPATAATNPQIKALQKQINVLKAQVGTLRTQLADVSARADAANEAATGAAQNASSAVAKTNCLVTATALVLWNNDVYASDSETFFPGTGLDIPRASDPVSAYAAGVNPSCVPSVFPRMVRSGFASFRPSAGHALLRRSGR